MTGPHKGSDLDFKTKEKIISLYRDHSVSQRDLCDRFGRSASTIKRVLVEAGLLEDGPSREVMTSLAFAALVKAAAAGIRCPTNDIVPGNSRSLSLLARDGKIFVEVFPHNFRRVTILDGEHKGKATANPPNSGGRPARAYLTIGLVKRRNGAVIPSLLDRRS